MTPYETFELAMARAYHFLTLYDLVQDSRSRSVRSDWAEKFLAIMHWPKSEKIVRVDGKDRNSILIMRECLGVERERFSHQYGSELLRSAVVSAVSAQDRYFHDIVVCHSLKVLSRKGDEVPKELQKVAIPIVAAKKAVDRARQEGNTRPGGIVKSALQKQLHRQFTFQNPSSVERAAKMLGVKDFWGKAAKRMSGKPTKEEIQGELRRIAERRNQIVHEADIIVRAKVKDSKARDIDLATTRKWVAWTGLFVAAADEVIREAV